MRSAAETGTSERHRARTKGNVTLPELLAGTRVRLHHQPAAPLEDRGERPTSDHVVQDAIVGVKPPSFAEGSVVSAEHIENPPSVKRSRSVVVPQVKGNRGVGLRVFLVDARCGQRVGPSEVGVQRQSVPGALLNPDNPRLVVRETKSSVPKHGVVALESIGEGGPESGPRSVQVLP